MNLKFPIPSGYIWILHIEVFCWNLRLEKTFHFFISKRSSQMFSDDVRRCLSLKTMPYLMPSHAIFKMKAGYTDIQAPKATAMMAKNLPKFGVPLKVFSVFR